MLSCAKFQLCATHIHLAKEFAVKDQHQAGRTAARITRPSQSLFSTKSPMPWVPAVKTDIRQTFARARQQMNGGVAA